MLYREDFVFTIGYDGPAAVVDNQAKKKYGKLSTRELAEKGLFRAAYSSAVYSKDPKEIQFVAKAYMRLGGYVPPGTARGEAAEEDLSDASITKLDRLFGVFLVDVKRSISL